MLSKERRDAGTRLVGAAAVDEADWGVILHSDGTLTVHNLGELLAAGSVAAGNQNTSILCFSGFHMPERKG